jgi:hypothetical protein
MINDEKANLLTQVFLRVCIVRSINQGGAQQLIGKINGAGFGLILIWSG